MSCRVHQLMGCESITMRVGFKVLNRSRRIQVRGRSGRASCRRHDASQKRKCRVFRLVSPYKARAAADVSNKVEAS